MQLLHADGATRGHAAAPHQPPKRRAVDSWLPLVFGLCVVALVATTWVGTHRSFKRHDPGGGDPWPPSSRAAAAARLSSPAAATAAAAAVPAGDAAVPAPGAADTAGAVTAGASAEHLFSSLAATHGVSGPPASGGSGGGGADGGAALAAPDGGEHNIELHPDRVAAVVGRARAAESLARLQGGLEGDVAASQDSAGRNKDLYHRGPGGLLLGPLEGAESAACPPGVVPPRAPQHATALVVLAGAGSAARLGPTLRELLMVLGHAGDDARAAFHVFVAVDGSDPLVKQVAVHYASEAMGAVRVIHHARKPGAAAAAAADENCSNDPGRPAHQLFLLRLLLECLGYPALLAVGPDARLAPDAPAFFSSAQWLLSSDRSLFCVAGGTAVGAAQAAADPALLLRSDAPPGPAAGWLVPASVGREALAQWRAAVAGGRGPPTTDDRTPGWLQFLATPQLRRGRQCLLPDLPRVWVANGTAAAAAAAAADGASHGVRPVPTPQELARRANATPAAEGDGAPASDAASGGVDWAEEDLSWVMEPGYSRLVLEKLRAAAPSTIADARDAPAGSPPRRVAYEGKDGYAAAMAALGLPADVAPAPGRTNCFSVPAGPGAGAGTREHCQSFLPPLSYRGVVATYNPSGARVFLVPSVYDAALGGAGGGGSSKAGGSSSKAGGSSSSKAGGSSSSKAGGSSSSSKAGGSSSSSKAGGSSSSSTSSSSSSSSSSQGGSQGASNIGSDSSPGAAGKATGAVAAPAAAASAAPAAAPASTGRAPGASGGAGGEDDGGGGGGGGGGVPAVDGLDAYASYLDEVVEEDGARDAPGGNDSAAAVAAAPGGGPTPAALTQPPGAVRMAAR